MQRTADFFHTPQYKASKLDGRKSSYHDFMLNMEEESKQQ